MPGAEPDLAEHLEVVGRAHPQALGLEELALALEQREPVVELLLDRDDGPLHPLVRRDVVGGREHRDLGEVAEHLAGDRVEPRDPLDRVAPPLDPDRGLLVRGMDLEDVALDAELPARQVRLVPQVLDVDQALLGPLHVGRHALVDPQDLALVLLGRAQAVDARDARHDQDVAPGQQRGGRRVPQALDLVVDRRVLLDVGVGRTGRRPRAGSSRSSETKYSTAFSGKASRNSFASWAASDLLGAMTIVGRWTRSTTLAIVKVLPVPVAPSRVMWGSPARMPSTRWSMAVGWSPVGTWSAWILNGGTRPV